MELNGQQHVLATLATMDEPLVFIRHVVEWYQKEMNSYPAKDQTPWPATILAHEVQERLY
jgi:hypothetical protein